MSSVSVVAMLLLLVSEFSYYRAPVIETHLAVDTTPTEDLKVAVETHLTFFHAPCNNIQVRVQLQA